MKALVIYESMFGNTRQVAEAITEGLATTMEVELHEVGEAPATPPDGLDLVVVGGPTHAFSMSRESTRQDAISRGATDARAERGIREWLDGLGTGRHTGKVATFDTRVEKVRHLPGSAARGAAKAAHKHGYAAAAKAESFYVADTAGPLLAGEVLRARDWGHELGVTCARS